MEENLSKPYFVCPILLAFNHTSGNILVMVDSIIGFDSH